MRRRLRGNDGISAVNAALVLALIVVGYFSWIYVPVFIEHQQLRMLVRQGCSKAYTKPTVRAVSRTILNGFPDINMVDRYLVNGVPVEVATPFGRRNVAVEFNSDKTEVSATVYYERRLVWPWLLREEMRSFTISHTEDLSRTGK